ncbi:MAG: response regulator [Proteobacteria bacterium]|nr:response regulator [Pseudomonadota bacterium]
MTTPPGPSAPSTGAPTRVLVTDDDPHIRSLLQELLEVAGYLVDTATNGKEGLEKVVRDPPDLLLLDVEMPIMTGWEVLQRIKSDVLLRHLPVLMLTSLSQIQDKVHGLDLGADDYLTKPFNVPELLARVRGALKRTRTELEANPLSRLPGNNSIEREVSARIAAGAKFFVLYADLNNFKAFNDRYGFQRGDRIIQETARILLAAVQPGDFVGHVGGDDFIVVTTPERAEAFCDKAIREFDSVAPSHYDPEDRQREFIEIQDRQGVLTKFPFVGIAIGGVTNVHRPLTSVGQVSMLGAEMKKFAKKPGRSAYAFDRRTD